MFVCLTYRAKFLVRVCSFIKRTTEWFTDYSLDVRFVYSPSFHVFQFLDEALSLVEQQVKNMEMKLSSAFSSHQSEKESWEKNLQNVEETWQLRFQALKSELEEQKSLPSETLQKEVQDLQTRYKKLKEEHDSFRDLADKLIEEKDMEITRLTDNNKNLLRSLSSKPSANNIENSQNMGASNSNTSVAEQQILILARQQAQREEELAQSQRHILALQEELEELEHENRLHSQQEAMLKEELRNMERSKKREGVDMTYLKNVIVKLLETGEVGALLPVIAMLLQFSPDEVSNPSTFSLFSSSIEASTPDTYFYVYGI
ncbi:putative GRIP domain-containing protein [Helianthus anomalus]